MLAGRRRGSRNPTSDQELQRPAPHQKEPGGGRGKRRQGPGLGDRCEKARIVSRQRAKGQYVRAKGGSEKRSPEEKRVPEKKKTPRERF